MRSFQLTLLIALSVTTLSAFAADLESDKQKYSYAMGIKYGQMLRGQISEDLDIPVFTQAINDVLTDQEKKLNPQQLQEAVSVYFKQQQAKMAELAEENLEKGKKFRDANGQKKGVTTLDNGLQYKILSAGEGESPTAEQKVEVHYRGRLINGEEFDSSFKRDKPAQFSLNAVVPGFREAITRMKPGAKWEVVIPPELAYGKKGAGRAIGPNETLIFEIEYLKAVK
ncbi:MAG: FKBP-type peptidyl-prolyl cis-trans isomerase [Candidatus Thiodiazotropha sp.]|jgi:FKBP-type peptidyl-prolyl cis-trans isomerase FklB